MRKFLAATFGAVASPPAPPAPAPDEAGRRRFFEAALKNDVLTVQQFVMEYPEAAVDWKDEEGMTALMHACKEGCREVAWLLIRSDPDIDDENAKGSTPLMFAALKGRATFIEMLLQKGADVNHINKNGHTALIIAGSEGMMHTAQLLLGKGASALVRDVYGKSAYDYAVEYGHTEVAQLIGEAVKQQEEAKAKADAAADLESRTCGDFVFKKLELPRLPDDDQTRSLKDFEKRLVRSNLTWRAPTTKV